MDKKQYGELLSRSWAIWKEYSGRSIQRYDWDKIIDETKEIWLDSGQDEMIKDILIAFIDDIERKDPERKEQ